MNHTFTPAKSWEYITRRQGQVFRKVQVDGNSTTLDPEDPRATVLTTRRKTLLKCIASLLNLNSTHTDKSSRTALGFGGTVNGTETKHDFCGRQVDKISLQSEGLLLKTEHGKQYVSEPNRYGGLV